MTAKESYEVSYECPEIPAIVGTVFAGRSRPHHLHSIPTDAQTKRNLFSVPEEQSGRNVCDGPRPVSHRADALDQRYHGSLSPVRRKTARGPELRGRLRGSEGKPILVDSFHKNFSFF